MDTKLAGKVALVTGGAHRIGRVIILTLAKAGCHILLHYNASHEAAEETAHEARGYGVQVLTYQANLQNPIETQALLQRGIEEFGQIQILINNAAIFPKDTVETISPEVWEHTFRVNLLSPLFLMQAFAKALPKEQQGAIVNITDGNVNRPDRFSYAMSKGALNHLTLLAAATFAPKIRVNAIALGAMIAPLGQDEAYIRQRTARIPLQREGGVEPVTQAILYLLQNEFVTGELLRVDGGDHLNT
ncbi:MAG: SDR family oxidoreductase [Chloroflexota bacterium]